MYQADSPFTNEFLSFLHICVMKIHSLDVQGPLQKHLFKTNLGAISISPTSPVQVKNGSTLPSNSQRRLLKSYSMCHFIEM